MIRRFTGPLLASALLVLPGAVALAETGALPALPDLPATDPVGLGTNTACADPAQVRLSALPPALVLVAVSAPCRAGEPVRIAHGGMSFAALMDDRGRYHVTLPALADPAEVSVTVGDDAAVSARQPVPDLASVTRLALGQRGRADLGLAADLPAMGDVPARRVDAQAPGLPTLAQGGFLTRLGDPALAAPHLAEVLTLPADRGGPVLSLLAGVTADNCGRDLLATLALSAPDRPPATGAISLALPDCDAVGERLVVSDADLRGLLVTAPAP